MPQLSATELGDRPAFPCSLPFAHVERCGMSTRLAIVMTALPYVITGKKTPAVIADEAFQIATAILQRETQR
jgi:hypothetical protein